MLLLNTFSPHTHTHKFSLALSHTHTHTHTHSSHIYTYTHRLTYTNTTTQISTSPTCQALSQSHLPSSLDVARYREREGGRERERGRERQRERERVRERERGKTQDDRLCAFLNDLNYTKQRSNTESFPLRHVNRKPQWRGPMRSVIEWIKCTNEI